MNSCLKCGTVIRSDWYVCPNCGKNLKFPSSVDKEKDLKYDKISRYYDLETLTQEVLDLELSRLHKEIEELEDKLIDLGRTDFENFYQERDKVREQLDTIYEFLFDIDQDRFNDFLKNLKLRMLYTRLPDWRIEQLKEKESKNYYHLKFRE